MVTHRLVRFEELLTLYRGLQADVATLAGEHLEAIDSRIKNPDSAD